ncbi:hypothetical protein BGP_5769 [Beggiatoa sp. PS]|nr:hypothetical protein BGP_5769 [Beggiatoa sp. PS]
MIRCLFFQIRCTILILNHNFCRILGFSGWTLWFLFRFLIQAVFNPETK